MGKVQFPLIIIMVFFSKEMLFFFFYMQKEEDGARSGESRVSVANSPQFEADSNV